MIELIIYGLLIYLAIMAIIWVVKHIVGPGIKYASIAALVIGVAVGAFAALSSYFKAVKANIHPYSYYVDKSKHPQPARRSYFFGPGFLQLRRMVGGAWAGIKPWFEKVTVIAGVGLTFADSWIIRIVVFVPVAAFALAAYLAIGVIGGGITVMLSLIHTGIMLAVMIVIYTIFSVTWIIDRIYLKRHAIKVSCPYCTERYTIPKFECPNCGQIHDKLVPGPYGIWHRKCTCGHVIPTTFLNGRSELKSYCPNCDHELAASDAHQVSISVVGGSSSGKTVLLSAFYHLMFENIRRSGNRVRVEIPEMNEYMFEDLEHWYQGAPCDPTALSDTSTMYSVLLDSEELTTRAQFSVYDIPGEAFMDPSMSSMIPQKHFQHANGLVIVIDPLEAYQMRAEAEQSGDQVVNYSESEAAAVIANFVTYLRTYLSGKKITRNIQMPVSVVITKADLASVKRRISYTHIRNTVKHGVYEDFDTARDEQCKQFLIDIGLGSVVDAITADFVNAHYYPVSAMGHEANGEEYEPEHVMEPFAHIIRTSEPVIADLLQISDI